jgi:periplasmic protein CpxP/Spy
MSRLAAALLLIVTLCFGCALLGQSAPATPPAGASSAAPSNPNGTPQEEAHRTLEKLGAQLNLTADQKAKLEPILTGEIQQVRDLRANTTMTMPQKQAAFQQTLTTDHDKIDAILTPDQKTKLAQLNQQQDAQQGNAQSAPPPATAQPATPPKQ